MQEQAKTPQQIQKMLDQQGWGEKENIVANTIPGSSARKEDMLLVAESHAYTPYSSYCSSDAWVEGEDYDSRQKEVDQFIRETALRCDLDEKEKNILLEWCNTGTRGNTFWMIKYLQNALNLAEKNQSAHGINTPEPISTRYLATVFFTDCFNRADEVFDEMRTEFETLDGVIVKPMDIPIIKSEAGAIMDLQSSMTLFWKIVGRSGAYSQEEIEFLQKEFNIFYQTSIKAMSTYESLSSYGEHEAIQIRGLTLRALSTFMSHIFMTSKYMENDDPEFRGIGHNIAEAISKLALITQLRDDLQDLRRDVNRNNTNIVYGIMQDFGENLEFDSQNDSSVWGNEIEYNCPKTTSRLLKIKEELTVGLPDRYKLIATQFDILD